MELTSQQRDVVLRLLRGEATVAEAASAANATRRDLVRWRRAFLAGLVPPREASAALPVAAPLTVRWDDWGVPHIAGQQATDLVTALGYCMAQERLWQLDWSRRAARGELAAILGRGSFEADKAMRIVGVARVAHAAVAALTTDELDLLRAFAAGVNAWIAAVGERLPLEFQVLDYTPAAWTVADSVAVMKYNQWLLTGRLENITAAEAARRNLAEEYVGPYLETELGDETIIPSPTPMAAGLVAADRSPDGSNNWAVATSRLHECGPVIASDPHQPFQQPGQYFEAHLRGGGLDVAGAFQVGTPICAFGRNASLAWGRTNHSVSVRDLYQEETEPGDSNRYRVGEVWRSFSVEEQAIEVKGEPTEYVSVRRSVRGPIVNGLVPELDYWSGPPLSLQWVGLEPATGLQAAWDLMRAENVAAARDALRGWILPVNNFVLADRTGTIAYQVAGKVPKRGEARRGYRRPAEAKDLWDGWYAFEDLPAEIAPVRGWVASANNPPSANNADWLKLGVWADGYRMRRIRERLEERERHTLDEVADIQADIVHARAVDLADRLAWWFRECGEPQLEQAAAHLSAWDGRYLADLVAPTLFEAFWRVWLERVADGRFPTRLLDLTRGGCAALARNILLGRRFDWFTSKTIREQVRAAAREAYKQLDGLLGPELDTWRWGRLHAVTFPHALAARPGLRRLSVGPFATSGGSGTVRTTSHGDKPPFEATGGSTYRLVMDLADSTQLWSVAPTGQSGHPGSRHYRDQARLWQTDQRKPLPLSDEAIDAALEGTTTIQPREAGG